MPEHLLNQLDCAGLSCQPSGRVSVEPGLDRVGFVAQVAADAVSGGAGTEVAALIQGGDWHGQMAPKRDKTTLTRTTTPPEGQAPVRW